MNEYAQKQIDAIAEACKRIKPLVAIRCITFNHEPYIRDALEGFVMQKTDFPFVAIVHDDASTDGTASIIREYAAKYPNIIFPIFETENQYSKHDGSLRRIMNTVCDVTGANYIAMCEGDDYWTDPCKLQKQINFLESDKKYSMCFTECYYKEVSGETRPKQLTSKTELTFHDLLHELNTITTLTAIYRKELLSGYPISKMPHWPLGDYPMWLYITMNGPAKKLDDRTSVYRVLTESACHTQNKYKSFRFGIALIEIQIYFAKYAGVNNLKFKFHRLVAILHYILRYPKEISKVFPYVFRLMY